MTQWKHATEKQLPPASKIENSTSSVEILQVKYVRGHHVARSKADREPAALALAGSTVLYNHRTI